MQRAGQKSGGRWTWPASRRRARLLPYGTAKQARQSQRSQTRAAAMAERARDQLQQRHVRAENWRFGGTGEGVGVAGSRRIRRRADGTTAREVWRACECASSLQDETRRDEERTNDDDSAPLPSAGCKAHAQGSGSQMFGKATHAGGRQAAIVYRFCRAPSSIAVDWTSNGRRRSDLRSAMRRC